MSSSPSSISRTGESWWGWNVSAPPGDATMFLKLLCHYVIYILLCHNNISWAWCWHVSPLGYFLPFYLSLKWVGKVGKVGAYRRMKMKQETYQDGTKIQNSNRQMNKNQRNTVTVRKENTNEKRRWSTRSKQPNYRATRTSFHNVWSATERKIESFCMWRRNIGPPV